MFNLTSFTRNLLTASDSLKRSISRLLAVTTMDHERSPEKNQRKITRLDVLGICSGL